MKKILSILLLAFFLSGNAYAKYIEIVCTPYDEYGEDGKTKKIWFTSFKPKYVFHFDEENLKITKIGITKDIKDLNSMDISLSFASGKNKWPHFFSKMQRSMFFKTGSGNLSIAA